MRDPNHGGSRRLRRLRICLFSIASSRFFPFIARVIRLRVRGKLVNEHVSSAISLTLSRDERAAMNFDPLSKRDEAVALVREGSVVFGASRYDSSLRCTRRRTQRLRRRTLHLRSSRISKSYLLDLGTTLPRRKRRRVGGAPVLVRRGTGASLVRSRGGRLSLVIASFVPSITPRVPIPRCRFFSSAPHDSTHSRAPSSSLDEVIHKLARARRFPPSWRPSLRTSRR